MLPTWGFIKELEALPGNVLSRVTRKWSLSGKQPRPAGCKKLKGYKDESLVPMIDLQSRPLRYGEDSAQAWLPKKSS
jgi:hypothetical protein